MKRLAIALIFVGTATIWAQTKVISSPKSLGLAPPFQVRVKKMGTATLAPSALRVVIRPAKRHTPKALTENGLPSGRAVSPTLKVDLPGGKRANSSDLLDGTNGLEANLNGLGYSLYTDENDSETPLVPLRPVTLDFNNQATVFRREGGMKPPGLPSSARNVSVEMNRAAISPAMGKTTTIVTPKVVNEEITLFKKNFGDPDWFSVNFDAGMHRHGDMKLRKLTAHADVSASMIGRSCSIFHAKAEVSGNRDLGAMMPIRPPGSASPTLFGQGNKGGKGGKGGRNAKDNNSSGGSSSSSSYHGSITLEATLLGDDLFPPIHREESGKAKKSFASKPLNWEFSVHIPIIPAVNAVGTIGAKGDMGVDMILNADANGGDISVIPHFKAEIYAQVGIEVNLFVASVEGGLGAELTLIDYKLVMDTGIGTTIVEKGGKSYSAVVTPTSVRQTLNTLKGNLYGYAKVGYWLPFKTHEKMLWKGDLFSWNGFTDSRTLYSDDPDPIIIGTSMMKSMKIDN